VRLNGVVSAVSEEWVGSVSFLQLCLSGLSFLEAEGSRFFESIFSEAL